MSRRQEHRFDPFLQATPPLLGEIGSERSSPQVRVASLNGSTTTYVREWKPDVVIVMHAVNDLYRSFTPEALAVGDYNEL